MSNTLLLTYMRFHDISDDMSYKESAVNQMIFMRDTIGNNLCKVPMFVVSSHKSKSIELPVYGFVMRNGVKVIARNNFYGWVVSVELPDALPTGYFDMDIFSEHGQCEYKHCYCEGFKESWVYGVYDPGYNTCTKFTVGLYDNYNFYMFIYLLNKAFPAMTFPEINRSESDVAKSIEDIYDKHLITDVLDMSTCGWEILWNTYSKLNDKIGYNKYSENPAKFAEQIMIFPDVYQEFIMDEHMFNVTF